MKYFTTINDEVYEIEINRESDVLINGEPRTIDFHGGAQGIVSLIIDNQSYEAIIEERDDKFYVLITGDLYEVEVTDERTRRLAQASGGLGTSDGELVITSPMPGLIVEVPVEEGQEVAEGQTVVILESMKMQNELKATRAGVVHRVNVKPGENVEQGKLLVLIG